MQSTPDLTAILQTRFRAIARVDTALAEQLSRIAQRPKETFEADLTLPKVSATRGPYLIASGWAGRVNQLKNGARQIVEILLPGDLWGVGPQPMPGLFTASLTRTSIVSVPDFQLAGELTRLGALHEALLAEQRFLYLNHILRLGRASAYCRMANMLAELHWRLAHRGLANDSSFVLPLTQEDIADTLGLSGVHVNRTLQQLRRDNLITHEPGRIVHIERKELWDAGDFHPPAL